jgi:hypothetical protein
MLSFFVVFHETRNPNIFPLSFYFNNRNISLPKSLLLTNYPPPAARISLSRHCMTIQDTCCLCCPQTSVSASRSSEALSSLAKKNNLPGEGRIVLHGVFNFAQENDGDLNK